MENGSNTPDYMLAQMLTDMLAVFGSIMLMRDNWYRSDLCAECGINPADPPSKLCPGCEAYKEHNA